MVILRPEPGASATAERARAIGLAAIVAPLFTIAPVAWDAPDPAAHDALMLTSANAVRHAGAALARYRGLPVWAVGDATAADARAAGFDVAGVGQGDAADLIGRMAEAGVHAPLHLAGREHRAVSCPGMTITRRIVYAADPIAALPDTALAALAAGAVALLHSPRAATRFAELVEQRGTITIAALSAAAAEAAGQGWRAVAIAATPDDAALLEAARGLAG